METIDVYITGLDHSGRGVARIDGKVVFVIGALPGETVRLGRIKKKRRFDTAVIEEVLEGHAARVEPPCPHFDQCGGCALQHYAPDEQIKWKESLLIEQLAHFGKVSPEHVLPPLQASTLGYRRRARLGVRYVQKKERVLVGFREKQSSFLADMQRCEVLHPAVGERIDALSQLVLRLSIYQQVPQIEVSVGSNDQVALIFRHLQPLTEKDLEILKQFGKDEEFLIYTQSKGVDTIKKCYPADDQFLLQYQLPAYDLTLHFHPSDFVQVHETINQKMIDQALALLDLQPNDCVLDLFCGLGNFSLPMARKAGQVVGVEGDAGLVARAEQNAKANNIFNISFYVADLSKENEEHEWRSRTYAKLLIDPPRCGAEAMIPAIAGFNPERIVYVSCDPATLARDAGLLAQHGYVLDKAGVMDMFPHTAHVESMALFLRDGE